MRKDTLRVLALGGILGPVLFTLVTVISAELRPDYNHMHEFISALGASETANEQLMNFAGFIPAGLLIVLFGFSMLMHLPKPLISKIGSLLIMAFGLGMMTAGVYSCDPGCLPDGTAESIIHERVSTITFPSAILGILLLGISFRKQIGFRKLMMYSLTSGFLAVAILATMISTFETRNFTGLWQRLLLLTIFIWTTVIGLYLFKSYKES